MKTVKHRAEDTLMSIRYSDIPRGEDQTLVAHIYHIDPKEKNKIYASPYLFPNVTSGQICFGNVGRPKDLRSAHTLFWNSPFNGSSEISYDTDAASNLDFIRKYKSFTQEDHNFNDITETICGKKFWSTTQKAEGLLITNNQELLKQIPEKFWLRHPSVNSPFLITLTTSDDQGQWKFWSRNFSFEVDSKFVETSRSKNLKVKRSEAKYKSLTVTSG